MWLGILALLVAGFIGGQSSLLLKLALHDFPPLFLTEIRFILAALIFLPFFLKQRIKLSKKEIQSLFLHSIFFSLNVGIFSIAIQYTTAILSQILYTLVPLVVIVISYKLLREKFTQNKIIGLLIAMLGVGFLISQSVSKSETLTFGTPLGNLLTLAAVLSWSFYMVLSKNLTRKYSPTTTSFFSFLTTVILLLFVVPFEHFIHPLEISKVSVIGLGSVLTLGIFSSALMFFLIQFSIKKTSPFTASFYQYVGPISAAITAIPFLGEKPTHGLIIGGFLTIIGVFVATTFPFLRKKSKSVLQ